MNEARDRESGEEVWLSKNDGLRERSRVTSEELRCGLGANGRIDRSGSSYKRRRTGYGFLQLCYTVKR